MYKNNFEDYILRVIMAFTCKCIIKVIFGVNEKLKKKKKKLNQCVCTLKIVNRTHLLEIIYITYFHIYYSFLLFLAY